MDTKYCELCDYQQREIKSQIELGISNKKLRCYFFGNPNISLDDLLIYAKTFDETEQLINEPAESKKQKVKRQPSTK